MLMLEHEKMFLKYILLTTNKPEQSETSVMTSEQDLCTKELFEQESTAVLWFFLSKFS